MKRIIYSLFYFLFWLLTCIATKCLFFLYYAGDNSSDTSQLPSVIWHGLPMDLSTTGYFAAFGLILVLVSCFFRMNKTFEKCIRVYTHIAIVLFAVLAVADIILYKYWGFRIDTTPLFYLQTPSAAMASATSSDFILGICSAFALIAIPLVIFNFIHRRLFPTGEKPQRLAVIPCAIGCLVLSIATRGGLSVATMNVGRVYFSENMFLNHSAVNPVWNFINSLTKERDFKGKYSYYDSQKVKVKFDTTLTNNSSKPDIKVLKTNRPNIFVIILESCGSIISERLGGVKDVAPNINKLHDEGISFTNFIGNSFRTDRGLVSILSGYPAQPTTSIMKYTEKSQKIPKFPLVLKENGYDLKFFYGGDVNFTNMRSYLVMSGFDKIVSQDDFKQEELSAKWGAYDDALFRKVLSDLETQVDTPFCKVMLTLSSHEPFDVPSRRFENKYLNSAAYTDSCLGVFISSLKKTKWWDNSLVLILPDHGYRNFPPSSSSHDIHVHRIPFLWIGGAVKDTMSINSYFSQIDIARTLLNQLDMDASEFRFSKDIFAKSSPQFGFYTFNDGYGMISKEGYCIYDCGADKIIKKNSDSMQVMGEVYLQTLMEDFSER